VEPITHALAAWTLSRAGLNRATKLATPILLVSGTLADADWLTYLLGPGAFLAGHRTAAHSILGIVAVAAIVGSGFWWLGRRHPSMRVAFGKAVALAAAGAALHVALDLVDAYGAKLLWPFGGWTAADLVANMDPWVLLLLLAGLLVPAFFALVADEVGARKKAPSGRLGAILALVLLALYIAGRGVLHAQATEALDARIYSGQMPRRVGAFPEAASPFTWHGIVETESSVHEAKVPLAPGTRFDPEAGTTVFKPEPSPILEAARQTRAAGRFLSYARFPKATVEKTAEGYTVTLRDLRFDALGERNFGVMAVVELDAQGRVADEGLRFSNKTAR
jgi:membrane-bound metal-dependent hydrolase YbcI (DUF457 family)